MIGGTNAGAAGGGLTFKLVGGTYAPSSPKENMIWVNTSLPIIGYSFSPLEPANPVKGMVWVIVGTGSAVAFNAIKKNSIMVYPLSAKQYFDEAWNDVTAMTYQNGSWVPWWNGELFQDGNQFESVTGGWEAMGFALNESWHATMPTLEIGETIKVGLSKASAGTYSGVSITKKKVDLTNWDTLTVFTNELVITKACEYSSGAAVSVLSSNDNSKALDEFTVKKETIHSGTAAVTKTDIATTLDVSDLSGEYYVAVRVSLAPKSGGSAVTADIANMLLLKNDSLSAADYQAQLAAAYQEGVNSAYDQ